MVDNVYKPLHENTWFNTNRGSSILKRAPLSLKRTPGSLKKAYRA